MGSAVRRSEEKTLARMAEAKVPVTMRDFFFDDPFFKRSWDDFDKVRDAMFQESRDMWKRFDEDFRDSACMKNNIMLDTDPRTRLSLDQLSSHPWLCKGKKSLSKGSRDLPSIHPTRPSNSSSTSTSISSFKSVTNSV